jgi:transcriptional regulator with XRE-family HTH domain
MTTSEILRANMTKARNARGLSRAELAEKAGLPSSTVGKIERSESNNSTIQTVVALADALDVNLLWLATDKGPSGLPRGRRAGT